jgi:hypothetical protein
VRNTLIVNERQGRLTEADVPVFLRGLNRLGVSVARSPDAWPGGIGSQFMTSAISNWRSGKEFR